MHPITTTPDGSGLVHIIEVGPRDGFQREVRVVPTAEKIRIITHLADAGLGCIQVTAFVHPERVPQMADAEALLAAMPRHQRGGTRFSGLVLNRRGLDRALTTDVDEIEVSASASEAHSRANTGQGWQAATAEMPGMMASVRTSGRRLRAGIQCAFGYGAPGDVPIERIVKIANTIAQAEPDFLALADTTGVAHPLLVRRTVDAVADVMPPERLIMHFHDTRGLGLVNAMAALDVGVRRFDAAVGGYGGCPAVPEAAGNIATEDLAHMIGHLGYSTGVDIQKVSRISRELTELFGHPGTGRLSMVT